MSKPIWLLTLHWNSKAKQVEGAVLLDGREIPIESPIEIGPDDSVEFGRKKTMKWAEIVSAIVEYDPQHPTELFTPGAQLEIGRALFDRTLGALKEKTPITASHLVLQVEDEHLARLPWQLLNRAGSYLADADWTISLRWGQGRNRARAMLPPRPRILVIAPELAGAPVGRQDHLNELDSLIRNADPEWINEPGSYRVTSNWKALVAAVEEDWKPDFVYYYGHGRGDWQRSDLIFQDASGQEEPRSLQALAELLNRRKVNPAVLYLNCCQGDADGLIGAGQVFAAIAACVITNRTSAFIDAARKQARSIWESVLIQGCSPVEAVRSLMSRSFELEIDKHGLSWFTPVIYKNYEDRTEWRSYPPRKPGFLVNDPHWQVKIDRERQWNDIRGTLLNRLEVLDADGRELPKGVRVSAFAWAGEPSHDVRAFKQRVEVLSGQLLGRLSRVHRSKVYKPSWSDFVTTDSSELMWRRVFGVQTFDAIAGKVDGDLGDDHGVVIVSHEPIYSGVSSLPSLDKIGLYLAFLDDDVARMFERTRYLVVVLIPFEVAKVGEFQNQFHRDVERKLKTRRMTFKLLDPLSDLEARHLLEFLKESGVSIPEEINIYDLLDELVTGTKGQYQLTAEKLRELVQRGFVKGGEASV